MHWSSCPGKGVLLTQGPLRAQGARWPSFGMGLLRVLTSDVSVLSLCLAESLDVPFKGQDYMRKGLEGAGLGRQSALRHAVSDSSSS